MNPSVRLHVVSQVRLTASFSITSCGAFTWRAGETHLSNQDQEMKLLIEMKEWSGLPETLRWIPGWPNHLCNSVSVINLKQYSLPSFSVMLCSLRTEVFFCLSSMYSTLSLYSGYSFKLFISSLFIQKVSFNVYCWGYIYEHDMFTVDPLGAHIDSVS